MVRCALAFTVIHCTTATDSKVQRVSLSPQRRSFGSGCSWKEASVGSTPPNEEAESRSVRPSNKERQWDPSNKERRDPSGRERRGSKQQPKITYKHDDEPEWMEFGPNDRSEVIELKGLEEHEREREEEIGRGEGDKQRVKDGEVGKGEKWRCGEDEEEVGRGGRKQSCGEDEPGGADTKPGACDETKVSVEQEGGEGETREAVTIVVNNVHFSLTTCT